MSPTVSTLWPHGPERPCSWKQCEVSQLPLNGLALAEVHGRLVTNSVTQSSPEESSRPFYRIMNTQHSLREGRGGKGRVSGSLCSCREPLGESLPLNFLARGQSLFPASSCQSKSLHFPLPPTKDTDTPHPYQHRHTGLSLPLLGQPPPPNNLAVTSRSHQTVCKYLKGAVSKKARVQYK